jgi:hypothetical protein
MVCFLPNTHYFTDLSLRLSTCIIEKKKKKKKSIKMSTTTFFFGDLLVFIFFFIFVTILGRIIGVRLIVSTIHINRMSTVKNYLFILFLCNF